MCQLLEITRVALQIVLEDELQNFVYHIIQTFQKVLINKFTIVTFESVVYVVGCFKAVKYYVMAYALIIITSISVLCIQAANL